jgi:hypothetical protein
MKKSKFKDNYNDEIKMFSEIYGVSKSVALDRLWIKFSDVNFDSDFFNEVTLVDLLWSKTN